MPVDVREALTELAPREVGKVDFEAITRRARRERALRASLTGGGLALALAAVVAVAIPFFQAPAEIALDPGPADTPASEETAPIDPPPADGPPETGEPEIGPGDPTLLPRPDDLLVVQRIIGQRVTIAAFRGDGTGFVELGGGEYPALSPDGTRVVFGSGIRTQSGLSVVEVDGTGLTQLTEGFETRPTWSPDGSQIAFGRVVDADPPVEGIWVMNADGSDQRLLVEDGRLPTWSPDGSQIAFVRYVDHPTDWTSDLWLVNADGTGERRLLETPERIEWFPAWSPDGTRITFMSSTNGEREPFRIDVVDADGSNHRPVTTATSRDGGHGQPRWSPDGDAIMFAAIVDGRDRLYVIRPDGTDRTLVPLGEDESEAIRYTPGAWHRPD